MLKHKCSFPYKWIILIFKRIVNDIKKEQFQQHELKKDCYGYKERKSMTISEKLTEKCFAT